MPPRRIMNLTATLAVATCMFVGCTQHLGPAPTSDIPKSALPVKEGSERLFFQTVDAGTIYVFDIDTVTLLFSTPIDRGQRFVLEPAHNRATIEGKPVYEKPLPKEHTFRIYFEPRVGASSTTQESS